MPPLSRLLPAVAAGGAVGSALRWGAGELAADGSGFPWTTFAINVAGSALLAALLLLPLARRSAAWAAALGPGLLGGFTTFSATSEQGRALLADDRPVLALTYLVATLGACVVAAIAVGQLAPALPEEDER
ncbi:fluoride efflux transporter FluC [Nocardioides caeni]|uniref:Fluoride-specific ion channel FluC n=1 Tax=Nocardioides caeni TaxID=574700 RepID=A0A4V4HJ28_9ACTN|nr:CrcB family protein [Nocardioides caeni]THV08916.1 CrcB family protein [Nocardioides caeni]